MTGLVFYVGGHPDDALLFRGHMLYNDLRDPGFKVVNIVTTAGDAGTFDIPYWQTREQGLVASFELASGSKLADMGRVRVGDQLVQSYSNDRCVCYFMRIPDGNVHGDGFKATGNVSLKKLRDDPTHPPLRPVDGSPVYQTWRNFRDTLASLLKGGTGPPWMNASDYNQTRDPGGHSDHYLTGDALQEFVRSSYNRYWWLSYCTTGKPANLSQADYSHKNHLYWDGYVTVMKERLGHKIDWNVFNVEWRDWGAKAYGTEEKRVGEREKTRVGTDRQK